MRKMKHVLSLLFVASMTAALFTGCGGGDDSTTTNNNNNSQQDSQGSNNDSANDSTQVGEDGLPPLTTDEIELTYLNFDDETTTQLLADKFMELHPNIKVKVQFVGVGESNDTLNNLINAQQTPDCFMYSDCDFALKNEMLWDMTEYWEADVENKNLLPTINELKIGYYFSGKKYGTPMKCFPGILYVDKNCLEQLNLEMPDKDWKWNEMIDLIKSATKLNETPAYYGLGYLNRLDSFYGIAASQDIVGEFGFNGKTFDLSIWAVGEQEFADLKLSNYVAPLTETVQMEQWLGDFSGWHGASGRVAVSAEAYWTYQNIWNTDEYRVDRNIQFVPYVVPSVEEVEGVHNSIGTFDMGGIAANSAHKREAYELLKFMGWGVDGWKARLDLYEDDNIRNSTDTPLVRANMPAPITMDQEVWNRYRALYPNEGDEKEYWDAYFESCTKVVPFGWQEIPGYWTYCTEYFNTLDIHNLVDSGANQAIDYADEATEQANMYFADAMKKYFGIDVTSDEYTFEKDTSGNVNAKLSFN